MAFTDAGKGRIRQSLTALVAYAGIFAGNIYELAKPTLGLENDFHEKKLVVNTHQYPDFNVKWGMDEKLHRTDKMIVITHPHPNFS